MSHRIRRVRQLETPATPLVGRFGLFAERLEVRTNDPRVLDAATASFGRFELPPAGRAPLVARIHVVGRSGDVEVGRAVGSAADSAVAALEAAHLAHETAGHLLSISLGPGNRAVVDVENGFGTATIGPELAAAPGLLRYAFVEAMALAMCTGGRGYVPVHASCVVRDGVGVVLQAPAGTGKSTLALACARRGWGLLAEDVVFASPVDGPGGRAALELWGMPWTQRLLPDATRFFPDLGLVAPTRQQNGEQKLEIDLDAHLPGAAVPRALAGPVALLVRGSGGPARAEWLSPEGGAAEVEVLWPWDGGWTEGHERTAARLLDRGVLRVHLNGTPDDAVDALEAALAAGPGADLAATPLAATARPGSG